MKKFQLQLDTDSINLENEIHSNNFPLKIKSLAEHCVNYIFGEDNSNDCNNKKYNKEVHDQEIIPTPLIKYNEDEIKAQKIIAHLFQFNEHNFKSTAQKIIF